MQIPWLLCAMLCLSVICWVSLWRNPATFLRLLKSGSESRFTKNPVGDSGLMLLMLGTMVTMVGLVAIAKICPEPTPIDQTTTNMEGVVDENTTIEPSPIQREQSTENPQAVDSKKANAGLKSADQNRVHAKTFSYLWMILSAVLLIVMAAAAYGTPLHQWGLGPIINGAWVQTIGLGILTFFLLVPPVVLIHVNLTWMLGVKYEHSTIDFFTALKSQERWDLLFWTFLQTGVFAAIVEEFAFRSALQGLFERMQRWSSNVIAILIGPLRPNIARTIGIDDRLLENGKESPTPKEITTGLRTQDFWLPILGSSILFALIHSGQGAAPISLYILGMGLGLLYKISGNLVACIIVHALLNITTLAGLLFR